MTMRKADGPDQLSRGAIVSWRTERLRAAGFSDRLARGVAADRGYDFHALLELVDRGCPAELAVRILAPLQREGRR